MKIFPVGAELFHADYGQTDMMELIVGLCKFVYKPKSGSLFSLSNTFHVCMRSNPLQ